MQGLLQKIKKSDFSLLFIPIFRLHLFVRLPPIARTTKHLTISSYRLSPLRPRINVICFHFRDLKMLPTLNTDSSLFFINFSLDFIRKCTQIEIFLISCQQIRINPLLVLYFLIFHQESDLMIKLLCVKKRVFIPIIPSTPV